MTEIKADLVVQFHTRLIDRFGGTHGLRDRNALDSTLASPFQTFDGIDLYPNTVLKIIRLSFLLVKNHCFLDGNKRIASLILLYLFHQENIHFLMSHNNMVDLYQKVASNKISYEEFKKRIQENISE